MNQFIEGVSVVIPNYNGVDLFLKTLPTVLEALSNIFLDNEIVIVDDCSKDKSIEYISANYPQIKLIQNENNIGFSKTANIGVRATKYNYVLLLNSDVLLTKYFFKNQIKYLKLPNVFGVESRTIGWEDEIIQNGAKYPSTQLFKIKTSVNYLYNDMDSVNFPIYTTALCGANMFFNKDVFYKIGGFDELFSPYYSEDYEISLRAWKLGYLCIYDHKSICRHKVSYTVKKTQNKNYVNVVYNRNKMLLHELTLDGIPKYLWYLQLFLELFFRVLTFNIKYIRSFILFIKSFKEIKKSKIRFENNSKIIGRTKNYSSITRFIKRSIQGDIYLFKQ